MNTNDCNMVSNGLLRIIDFFNKHPNSQNMTYGQHFRRSFKLSLKMCLGFIFLFIHSIFPFLFELSGSKIINQLHEEVNIKSHKES